MDQRDEVTLGLSDFVLDQVAPEQRPLLDELGKSLIAADGRTSSDGSLGFGVAEVAWIAAVVPVSRVVVDYLLDVLKDTLQDALKGRLTAVLESLRSRKRAAQPLPLDIVNRAQAVALEHGLAVGLDEPRARLLAAAVAGSLAGATPVA